MKKYYVQVAWSGYVSREVEAANEEEAVGKVERMGTEGINDFERWYEADMVREIPE